jgi:hypothetical protein
MEFGLKVEREPLRPLRLHDRYVLADYLLLYKVAGVGRAEGVGKPHAHNSRIERLNGTLHERVKVQRGWKSMKAPLAEGARIHYNFVKPHQALEGQTPAQRAGLVVEGENKWLSLMRGALTTKGGTAS